jgi:predicted AAA+ superfamily ATPase
MSLIKRQISQELISLAGQFPAVTILGPRQAGKTTLARSCFPDYEYVNLELPHIRKAAQDDAAGFFKMHPGPMILDEIQRVPELLSYIQALSDERKKKGEFILTGSHQPKLAEGISQSLAGRTGLLTLLPFSISELESASLTFDRDTNIHNGFMPGIHCDGIEPNAFYRSYFQTYVERDVKMLINVSNQYAFETFVRLLAGRVGQVVNLHSLAGDAGVSSTTLAAWLSVLEASYIVFRLPGYFNNFGKRLIKAPKIYFYEVGLAAWLLGIEKPEQVGRDPLIGGLFENMVVLEALKAKANAGREKGLHFFRDRHGLEVDLLVLRGRDIMPVEIKSGMTYDRSFSKNLLSFRKIAAGTISPTLVYSGEESVHADGIAYINYKKLYETIAAWDAGAAQS